MFVMPVMMNENEITTVSGKSEAVFLL